MLKTRRYLRGSGRVLAFVFIASIVWLLLDMVVLRISIADSNSHTLKEQVIRERQLFKQQSKVTQIIKRTFKHPVQKVDQDAAQAGRRPPNPNIKLGNAYRGGGRKDVLDDKSVKSSEDNADSQLKINKAKYEALDQKGKVTPKQKDPAKKKAVNLDLHATKAVKSGVLDDSNKMSGSNKTKVLQGVQEIKHIPILTTKKALIKDKDRVKVPVARVESEKVKEEPKLKIAPKGDAHQVKESHPVKPTAKPPKEDVQEKEGKFKMEDNKVQKAGKIDLEAVKETPKPTIKVKVERDSKDNARDVKKPRLHKVLSLDLTNAPRDPHAAGQFGQAAKADSNEDVEVRRRWGEGHFNVYLSDKIPVDRAIPDTRPDQCKHNLVHDNLPSTSVIFCFVDEVWSTLLRSVHSVLNRSPPHLLKEIILVDDFSTREYLGEKLDKYMSQFPKVRIVRLKERQGLIRARMAGAAIAKGEVLTFLDSHVECNVGWLEPLLERVYMDRKKVPCPVIEVISDKDMSYMLVDNFQRGIFKWPLVFGWSPVPEEHIKKNNLTVADPIRCPVMAGGLFSIDRNYFYELGAYDPGLDVWGGENMEISFKVWMCGGEIEIIPCSRVGHIFRGQNPYKFPKDRQKTVERNLARVAEVWLDEYKDLFYGHGYHHLLSKDNINIGNLTEQIELRKSLKCKSFKWYLDNVFPDMEAPLVKAEGLVFNHGLRKCLSLQEDSMSFEICDLDKQSQHFNYTWVRLIQQKDLCIVAQHNGNTSIALQSCDSSKPDQRWLHKSKSSVAEHIITEYRAHNMCLEAGAKGDTLQLRHCEINNSFQKWQFTLYNIN